MDRPAMRRGGADELEHRLGRVVVEDELVERVGIQRPAARFVGQRPLEYGSKVGVHRSRAVDVRVPREDEVDASILVGLEELSFHGQPDPSFHGMRFLGMSSGTNREGGRPYTYTLPGNTKGVPAASAPVT